MSGAPITAASIAVEIGDTLPSQDAFGLSSTDKLKSRFLAFFRRSGAYVWSSALAACFMACSRMSSNQHCCYLMGVEWLECDMLCKSLTALTLATGHRESDGSANAVAVERQLAAAAASPEQALMDTLTATRSGEQDLCDSS